MNRLGLTTVFANLTFHSLWISSRTRGIARQGKVRNGVALVRDRRLRVEKANDLASRIPHHDALVLARPDVARIVDVDAIWDATARNTDHPLVDGEHAIVQIELEDGRGA